MKFKVRIVACLVFFAFQISKAPLFQKPLNWPEPTYDFKKNPLDAQKVFLGRVLFYDPILSANNTISCASCHSPYNAFTHADHALSHGIYDSIGKRNSPALMNLAWQKNLMWDGAINHLDVQALAPINNALEMGENTASVINKLRQNKRYRELFYLAWQDSNASTAHMLKSLSQFMLTLVSSQSKYDSVKLGSASFTEQEQRGYALFLAHCNSCHTEPLFTNLGFERNGLCAQAPLNDLGRYAISGKPNDSFLFKVPSLRNLEFSYPYMHDGRFKTLSEVINHYNAPNCKISKNNSPSIKPLGLNSNQKVDLQAFLLTLTDRQFLFNPNYAYPRGKFAP